MTELRLAEIKARLAERPPISALSNGNADKSPVATYLNRLRDDQIELVAEVERLKALTNIETRELSRRATILTTSTREPRAAS